MSGIAAIYHRDGRPVERDDIERVARTLAMYGRERQIVRTMGPVAFAYTHFTNTPEARGQFQPVTGGGGRYTLMFDGRLDNRDELAATLGIDTSALALLSDAAVAVHCWDRWSIDTLNKWLGEFALIVWDATDRRLIAARHQFGYRPLSYHVRADRLVIASAPKGIHALGDVPRAVDEQKIADALCQFYGDGERSYFKDIRRVPAGTFLVAESGSVDIKRYYDLENHIRPVRYARDSDYVDAARDLLETAVKARLRSPGPIGAFMSGGLDSSTVAVTAARMLAQQGKRLPTFTSVPEQGWDGLVEPHCYGDETPYVKAIAEQHANIELNFVDAAGLGLYHRQDELLEATEAPVRNALNVAWVHAILEQAKTRGIRVMLEGALGNLTFSYPGDGVYTHHWREGNYRQLLRELMALSRSPIPLLRHMFAHLVIPLDSGLVWSARERLRGGGPLRDRWLRFITARADFARAAQVRERAEESGFNFFGKPPANVRDQWIRLLSRHIASETGDVWQGLSAMYGIEVRDPFADRRLIEWSLGVPEDQFRRNGQARWLIKRLMRHVLPDSVLFKPRNTGRQTPDWHLRMSRDRERMRADLAAFAQDPDHARMIDVGRLQALLDDWPAHTVTDDDDDRRFFLPINVPLALQVGRFVQRVKGSNTAPT